MRYAWLLVFAAPLLAAENFSPGGATSPDGKATVVTDLPLELRQHNTGGRDGAGLCVFTSIEHAARYQNELALWELQKYMTQKPGGGYPEKVTSILKGYAPNVEYVQHTGGSADFLELALKTGRMVSVTYNGRDDFYRGTISHMVNLVYLDAERAAILDNNREKIYLWMTRDEFLSRWRGGGGGWAVVLLKSPAAPFLR